MILHKTLSIPGLGSEGMEIPYFEIVGEKEGPTLTLVAGVHGAEYASIAAVREFAMSINPAEVSGKIVAVPILNLASFWARSAFVVPVDGKNLNRTFPGNAEGSFTEILAHHIFQTFIKGSDFLVDSHAGDIPEALEPFAMFEESAVEAGSLLLAKAYGLKHVVRQSSAVRTVAGSTCAAAADIGIPAIIAESGQNGILTSESIAIHVAGLTNLARSVGVLSGEAIVHSQVVVHEGWNWLRAHSAGWWTPLIQTGNRVQAGEIVGTLHTILGELIEEIRTPEAGVVLFQTSSPAVSVDGILMGIAR